MMESLLPRLKKTWWFAWIVALVLALSQLSDAADGLDKLLVLTKFKPDELAIAKSAEKGEFSRAIAEAAWHRLFWARAFQARIKRDAPEMEINEAWKEYIKTSEAWSSRIMVFIVTTEKFFGAHKANQLEVDVQDSLNNMAESLANLRYSKAKTPELLKMANDNTEKANRELYKFVRGFEQNSR